MNQTQKIVHTTKPKPLPLKECVTATLRGKKVRDMYTKVYGIRNTIFPDQTCQLPKRLMHVNNYIVVLVEINSNATMVEPMKSCKDAK